MKNTFLQISLLSHESNEIYPAEKVAKLAMECGVEGAQMIHVHIYKLGSIEEFMKMIYILEENQGPFINLSVSDFEKYVRWTGKKSPIVKSAAIHGYNCRVFGNKIEQTYELLEQGIRRYISEGILPEVSIFNKEGAEICAKLNRVFPNQFFVGVYLDYPDELEATPENIEWIAKKLGCCKFVCYAVYYKLTEEHVNVILKNGGHLRCGLEDGEMYFGKKLEDVVDITRIVAKKIVKYGNKVGIDSLC